ncbi:MAG TPA: hypothetical protein VFB78_16350 [Acidimicrobiales bacterium]|nr:hypothetical protein [Acidimicrobiales bacterium]
MRKLIALVGLSVLFLGACGSDSKTDDNASGSTTTAAASSGNNAAAFTDFCGARAGFTPPNPAGGAGDLKSNLEAAEKNLDKAGDYAPSEIKNDVKTVAAAYKKFIAAMKAANYNYASVNPADLQAIGTADVQAAGQRITAWVQAHCS